MKPILSDMVRWFASCLFVIAAVLAFAVHVLPKRALADAAPTTTRAPQQRPHTLVPPVRDVPSQDVIDSIVDQLNREDEPAVVKLTPTRSKTTRVCGMRNYRLSLSNPRSGASNSYSVLVENSSPRINELFAVLNVVHVDADGSPRSYHPEDPLGRGRCTAQGNRDSGYVINGVCALDNFASGDIKVFQGKTRLSGPEMERQWVPVWRQIRDQQIGSVELNTVTRTRMGSEYYLFHSNSSGVTAFFKRGIIPSTNSGYPCTYGPQASFPGYFVSATSLRTLSTGVDTAPPECRASTYINPEKIPFFVLPGGAIGNLRVGDVVVAATWIGGQERMVFGVIGDAGPKQALGEGSIAFLQGVLGKAGEPVLSGSAVNALDIGRGERIKVALLILGNTKRLFDSDYSYENLQRVAREQFDRWGGSDPAGRMKACAAQVSK